MRNGYCYGPVVTFGPSKYAGVSGRGDGRRIGGTDVFSGRAKLLWEPTSDISALPQYEIIRGNSEPAGAIEVQPAGNKFLFNVQGVCCALNTGERHTLHGPHFHETQFISHVGR